MRDQCDTYYSSTSTVLEHSGVSVRLSNFGSLDEIAMCVAFFFSFFSAFRARLPIDGRLATRDPPDHQRKSVQ